MLEVSRPYPGRRPLEPMLNCPRRQFRSESDFLLRRAFCQELVDTEINAIDFGYNEPPRLASIADKGGAFKGGGLLGEPLQKTFKSGRGAFAEEITANLPNIDRRSCHENPILVLRHL